MYRLPTDFDPAFLIGRTLDQICFTANTITFQFDGEVAITLEGGYAHGGADLRLDAPIAFVPEPQPNLMELIEHAVLRAEGSSDGTLTLFFDHGQQLRCFDHAHYEAYQIRHGERVIIV
jgi:hypothetical protein